MDYIAARWRSMSFEQKNKTTFLIWMMIYVVVFTLAIVFDFEANLAMGVSIALAGMYSIFTGYAIFNSGWVQAIFNSFYTKLLGRAVGVGFFILGLSVMLEEVILFDSGDEGVKYFLVLYPIGLIVVVGLIFYVMWEFGWIKFNPPPDADR